MTYISRGVVDAGPPALAWSSDCKSDEQTIKVEDAMRGSGQLPIPRGDVFFSTSEGSFLSASHRSQWSPKALSVPPRGWRSRLDAAHICIGPQKVWLLYDANGALEELNQQRRVDLVGCGGPVSMRNSNAVRAIAVTIEMKICTKEAASQTVSTRSYERRNHWSLRVLCPTTSFWRES